MLHVQALSFKKEYPKIQRVITKLLSADKPVSKIEYEEVFRIVFLICMRVDEGCELLYKKIKMAIEIRITDTQSTLTNVNDYQTLLKVHTDEWKKFFGQFKYIADPLKKMDTVLARDSSGDFLPVRQLLMDTWKRIIVNGIEGRLISGAMKAIEAERNSKSFNTDLVVGLRDCFIEYGPDTADADSKSYRHRFEKDYIATTESFYKARASNYLQEHGISKYMKFAKLKITEEEERGQRCLGSGGDAILTALDSCDKALIEPFLDVILAEFPSKLRENDAESLSVIFWCVDRVSGRITPMLVALEEHIVDRGLADMVAEAANIVSDSDKYVQKLIDLFNGHTTFVKDAFNDDPRFVSARDKAFKKVINDTSIFKLELRSKTRAQPESRCPELLANYCDLLLRKTLTSKKLTPDKIESTLKDVIYVLKFVQNKDVFMQYYTSHLTRRLILQTSNDNDQEENMVRWLRDIGMPADFVNRVTQMFQDIKLSDGFNQNFKENYLGSTSIDANAKILNAGAWKVSDKLEITLPVELEKIIVDAEEFYQRNRQGRKLHWNHNMSNATISFQSDVGKYDLDVTNVQMSVLSAWNQHPDNEISFENLRMTTLLPDNELKRTAWSLLAFPHIKEQILICHPEAKSPNDLKDDAKFSINRRFAVYRNNKPQKRGKISLIGRLQLSTDKTNREDNDAIVALRILRTQEAIVRVLKSKKTCVVLQLQMEVVDILKNTFLPTIAMIKEQIEWLIENEFIRRDEGNMNTLFYIT